MLDFIYYPISAILWFWHKVFGFGLGPDSGLAWALAVVFLVFTLRALLFKPFVTQMRTQRQTQRLQPQIKALQKKYAGDRQRLATEIQNLQREHRYNPLLGCLPMLVQIPVFIGLFHVLRSFNRTGTGAHIPFLSPTSPMSVADNANTANYFFGVGDVQSFLHARIFGAPLSAMITTPIAQFEAFIGDTSRLSIALVALPLMVVAAISAHFTARASIARATIATTPQTAIMNKLALWVFPIGALVGGPFLPIAVLIYWLAQNAWTLAQQHYVLRKLAAEDDLAADRRVSAQTSVSAPRPGARPVGRSNRKHKR